MPHHVSQVAEQAILFRNDTILLLHHTKRGSYQLPGGRLDQGEDGGEGLIREIREETGFEMEIDDFTLFATKVIDREHEIKYGVFYVGRTPEGDVTIDHPHNSYTWANRNEVEDLTLMFPETRAILNRAFDQRLTFFENTSK